MFSPTAQTEIPWSAYPERIHPKLGWLDRQGERLAGFIQRPWRTRALGWSQFLAAVETHGQQYIDLSLADIQNRATVLGQQLRLHGFQDQLIAKSFALIRQAAEQTVGVRHYDVQLIGGRALLRGMIAEMETGEGKTLTATLPACTAALQGLPVHIVTINDYLASRDAEWMGPLYRALGLSVGVIKQGLDWHARRSAYMCHITYCTNKEVAFDYLKDRIVLGQQPTRTQLHLERLAGPHHRLNQLLLRGLQFAIIDEADSVLIDEARTPLIISGPSRDNPEQHVYEQGIRLAEQLEPFKDFLIQKQERSIQLTPYGKEHLTILAEPLGGIWKGRQRREHFVKQALTARHLFQRDKHYLVRDNHIQIIDEYTGRVMPDRSWEHDLHQFMETKEGCDVGSGQDPVARMTYQRFFRRYLLLSGMTGTAHEVQHEMWEVYKLPTMKIPTNRPLQRNPWPTQIFASQKQKWKRILESVSQIHQTGRPILIGTSSVATSEMVSGMLESQGLPHEILNAKQDQEEARVIAEAGKFKQITVATSMAGRGTDIILGPGVSKLGGLHVLSTEKQEARRIDRQLCGRCGRQGDPGSYQLMLSLEDEILSTHLKGFPRWLLTTLIRVRYRAPTRIAKIFFFLAQRRVERHHSKMRKDLIKMDEQLESTLAFSGKSE